MRKRINKNPLRKIVGEIEGEEVFRDDEASYHLKYEKLECGHRGASLINQNEYFGVQSAKSRRCEECGKGE
jgi:hypothetical protein